jgi:hypothetical protein
LPQGWDASKRNVAIFNGVLAEFLVFDEWRDTAGYNQNAVMEQLIKFFRNNSQIHFYLRIHPNLRGETNVQMHELKQLAARGYENLTVIWPEDVIDTYELVDQADKILTFGSTVGVEACFWGKASILWGVASYEDLDCAYKPKTFDEICSLIQQDLPPKPKHHALPYGYWEMMRGVEFKYYKPTGLSEGTFQGATLLPTLSLMNKIQLRFDSKMAKISSKIKSLRGT